MTRTVDEPDHFPEPTDQLRSYAVRLIDPAVTEREPLDVLRIVRALEDELAAYKGQLALACVDCEEPVSYAELGKALGGRSAQGGMSRQGALAYVQKLRQDSPAWRDFAPRRKPPEEEG